MAPKPILLNETGKEIVQKMKELNSILGMIAGSNFAQFSTWDMIREVVASGAGEQIFPTGKTFNDKFTNVDNGTVYEKYPWHVNAHREVTLESGDVVQGMILQPRFATPQDVQFTGYRAFLACPNGLKAGTYHLTLGQNWGSNAVKDKTYQFTLTQDVVAGGRLGGFRGMPDTKPASWKVYSYKNDGKTLVETVDVTEGGEGIDLGVMNFATRRDIETTEDLNGVKMNCMQECAYGHNRWKTSAIRQWLNSDKAKGQWWKAQDEFDLAPNQADTISGFLAMLPTELVDVIKPVKVVTYTNTVNDGGEADITYDKVFLPSLEEMFINKQVAGEGDYHPYWKERAGVATPVPWYTSNDRYINYGINNTTAGVYVWLRSANRGHACYEWYVNPSGGVYSGGYCAHAFRSVPLICIC